MDFASSLCDTHAETVKIVRRLLNNEDFVKAAKNSALILYDVLVRLILWEKDILKNAEPFSNVEKLAPLLVDSVCNQLQEVRKLVTNIEDAFIQNKTVSDSETKTLEENSQMLVDISKDIYTFLESFSRPCPPQDLKDSIEQAFQEFEATQTSARAQKLTSQNNQEQITMSQNNQEQTTQAPPPASRYPEAMRTLFAAFAHHGKPLRGLMSTAKSRSFQGRFGRMFPLPAATYGTTDTESRLALMALGKAMTSELDFPKDGFDGEESGIPALYTYFGQFIDHDITFDPMTILIQYSDPDAITDFRTPALDLDNMYGRGPSDQPYIYDNNGTKFLLGDNLDNGAPDLQRNNADPARALISDPRNDENSIVSQFQALMLRFHNRVVDDNPKLDFLSLQKIVRWHYQWVIVYDFLPRLISGSVLDALKTNGRYDQKKLKFYHWKNNPFMPVEFSAAAYRLGHSMIRPGYRLNDDDATLLPIFPIPETVKNAPPGGISPGLTGFQAIAKNRGIDWGRFIDIGDPRAYGGDPDDIKPLTEDMKKRLQFAYRLDTSVVTPLSVLPEPVAPDQPRSLAQRNLLRGFELGLPTGQSVAKAMDITPLTDDQIIIGKAVDKPEEGDVLGPISKLPQLSAFRGKCPLWTYILAEAAINATKVSIPVTPPTEVTTPQLGEVGGRIVAEVFLGMLFGDKDSFLSADPEWIPTIGNAKSDFGLRDMVAYALFSNPAPATRRPANMSTNAPPPTYSPAAPTAVISGLMSTTADSPYAFLTQFDTVFLIDDSGSMAGRSWDETKEALSTITPICTDHDADGIDIYFLNHRNPKNVLQGSYANITTPDAVNQIFRSVGRPVGGTTTGTRLNHILKPYLDRVETVTRLTAQGATIEQVKPLNIIVITDGVPSDDVESVIVRAAKRLDQCNAEPWQVGIQFFQVGHEPEAAEDLRKLDDDLENVRDMVDTVPWSGEQGEGLNANGILKVVLGAVNRRLDRKPDR